MDFTIDFVTDFVTELAHENGVAVPTDFDAQKLIDRINERLSVTNGFSIATDDFESLHEQGLALSIESHIELGL